MARQLGISKDVQSKAGIPIGAPARLKERTAQYPNSYDFPVVKLVRVAFDGKKEIKRQSGEVEETPVLIFVFAQSATKVSSAKQFTHIEFPIDDEDAKFDNKLDYMHQRIKHIFDETVGASRFDETKMQGTTFAELFENVANAFNVKPEPKPAVEGEIAPEEVKFIPFYSRVLIYLKVIYYKDKLQLPQFPNFVQRASVDGGINFIPCELNINPTYDKIEPQAQVRSGGSPVGGGMISQGTNAEFGGGGDFDDFPEV